MNEYTDCPGKINGNFSRISPETGTPLIRAPKLEDYPDLIRLERGASGNRYQAAVFIRQMMSIFPGSFLVADTGESVGGYIIGTPPVRDLPGWILRIRVREDLRRRGIGTALLHTLLHSPDMMAAKEIRLSVAPDNSPARHLYQRSGFSSLSYEKEYFGEGEDRVLMAFVREP